MCFGHGRALLPARNLTRTSVRGNHRERIRTDRPAASAAFDNQTPRPPGDRGRIRAASSGADRRFSLRSELALCRTSSNGQGRNAESIAAAAVRRAELENLPSLQPAINATGIVLHTGLGRAVLCEDARQAVAEVAAGHSTLEVDVDFGRRGSRHDHARGLLQELTGAENAIVVNNNAGAVFLAVTALAQGKEVIISRGELIEIGGSFRMPDIISASGAALVEVGTTNRTRLKDFQGAISERTGLLLRCHPSNFRVMGFTEDVSAADLAALGQKHGIPVMDDLGSALSSTPRCSGPGLQQP